MSEDHLKTGCVLVMGHTDQGESHGLSGVGRLASLVWTGELLG